MTLPRPVLIALLGLALCAAAFLATRSANDTGSAVTSVTPTPAPSHTPAKPAKPAHPAKVHKATATQPKPAAKPQAHAAAPAATKPPVADKPATTAKPPVSREVAKTLPVIKALGRGDVVVFFFTHPGPADDTGARIAVRGLAHEKHVSVFEVGLEDLETYRPVLAGAGVSQVPAIVVVHAGRKARLI